MELEVKSIDKRGGCRMGSEVGTYTVLLLCHTGEGTTLEGRGGGMLKKLRSSCGRRKSISVWNGV